MSKRDLLTEVRIHIDNPLNWMQRILQALTKLPAVTTIQAQEGCGVITVCVCVCVCVSVCVCVFVAQF